GQSVSLSELGQRVCDCQSQEHVVVQMSPESKEDRYEVSGHPALLILALDELVRNAEKVGAKNVSFQLNRAEGDGRVHLAVHNDGCALNLANLEAHLGTGILFCQFVALRHQAWFG